MNVVGRGFDTAFAAAQLSDAPRVGLKMGAALYTGSRLLAVGANLYGRTHPASATKEGCNTSTHAEHTCLLKRQHYDVTSKLTLYIARRKADGSIGTSRPCTNCLNLCRMAGVSRIWFFEHGEKKEIVL